MKNLFLLAFLSFGILCNGQSDSSQYIIDESPFLTCEEMPEFIGGEAAMMKFIATNVVYPDSAIKKNIEGIVRVMFKVSSSGKIMNPKILNKNKLGYGCEVEAIRVVMIMPKWKPGYQNGIPVAVYYNLPIRFRLN